MQKNKKVFLLFLLVLHVNFIFSKSTSVIIGTTLNLPPPGNLMFNQTGIKNRPLLGSGVFMNIYKNKRKVSSIVYGAELSSMRVLFKNSSFKLPVYYSFKFPINRSAHFNFNLGTNILIQPSSVTTNYLLTNDNLEFSRTLYAGIFPLLHIDLGIEYETKNKRNFIFSLGFNKGLSENEKLTLSTKDFHLIEDLDNTYIELRVGYKLIYRH